MSEDSQRWIAVLGRQDGPTDGVADYCTHLSAALGLRGYDLEIFRVPWPERGWGAALADLRRRAEDWRGCWVLLQHTALGWSRRGFPLQAPRVLAALRQSGARCCVVFHESGPAGGSRIIDRARNYCQLRAVQNLYEHAKRAVFTVPLEMISWIRPGDDKAIFIPIGANFPEPHARACKEAGGKKAVAIFSVTGGAQTFPEVADIGFAMRQASRATGPLRLVVMGRGSKEAEPALREELSGTNVAVEVLGLVSAEELSRALAGADVQLFVRGPISTRRGTAIAGIACGLPVVCYAAPETGWPVTEAGILSVPLGDREALSAALERVLCEDALRISLAARSRQAHEKYFSWSAIADQFVRALPGQPDTTIEEVVVKDRSTAPLPARQERRRILLVSSHVVQYGSPLFREISKNPRLDVLVAFCSMQGAESGVDPEFGVEVAWDTPVLEGFPWVHVPNRSLRPGLGHFFGLFNPGLWKLIREGKFDAILSTGYFYASAWIAILAARWHGVPILFTTDGHNLRTWATRSTWKQRLKKFFVRRIFALGEVILAGSSGSVDYLKSLGIPPDRILLGRNVVDNPWWLKRAAEVDPALARENWHIPVSAAVVLFCAKLQPWKGPQDLLEAFARAHVPGSYLLFAGDGPLRKQLEERARSLGLSERVRFLGFVNQSQLPSVYRASDLLVLPSIYEPFGFVVNEAMLCGCPAAVSDRVGAKYDLVREGETGYVFPAGDIGALAAVLQDFFSDTDRRVRMGEAARKRMRTWSPAEYVDAIAKAVDLAVESRRQKENGRA